MMQHGHVAVGAACDDKTQCRYATALRIEALTSNEVNTLGMEERMGKKPALFSVVNLVGS